MKTSIRIAILLLTMAASVQQAHAQVSSVGGGMRDHSLSPEDSFKQPSINNNPVYQNDLTRRSMVKDRAAGIPVPGDIPPRPDLEPAKSFMTGYCDADFIPLLANNRRYFGMEDCLKYQRDEACSRFNSMPKEIKMVMDDAIGCLFTNGNGYAADDPTHSETDYMVCGSSYARRIEMLKKYMSDVYATYVLVYLPDDVLDSAGRCVNRTTVNPKKKK